MSSAKPPRGPRRGWLKNKQPARRLPHGPSVRRQEPAGHGVPVPDDAQRALPPTRRPEYRCEDQNWTRPDPTSSDETRRLLSGRQGGAPASARDSAPVPSCAAAQGSVKLVPHRSVPPRGPLPAKDTPRPSAASCSIPPSTPPTSGSSKPCGRPSTARSVEGIVQPAAPTPNHARTTHGT